MNLSGCGTALITPFHPDGSLDLPALSHHVKAQVAAGISLLIPCGTTGEAATLTEQETHLVIETTIAAAAGRVPVFVGCTHNSTAVAVANARKLAAIHGLSGILTANPYYNRPSQEGQYQHFKAIAQAVDVPILLYNIPGRTGANLLPETVLRLAELPNIVGIKDANLLPETVLRLAELPNIVGIKESSGNVIQITELLTQTPADFAVFAGDDALALPILALGGVGLISVASNAIPGPMSQLIAAALTNDWAAARTLNARYFALMQAHFTEPSPSPIKAVLALLGQCHETLRLPMVPVTEATRTKLEAHLRTLNLLT